MFDPEERFTGLVHMPAGLGYDGEVYLPCGYIDGFNWLIPHDVSYRRRDGVVSTVRGPWITDFSSIPRVLWRVAPPTGLKRNPYGVAAVFHDWVYFHGQIAGKAVSKGEADALYAEIMDYLGCRKSLTYGMWFGLWIGGGRGWNRARKENPCFPSVIE